jgi:CheY-like chemotaxis protein
MKNAAKLTPRLASPGRHLYHDSDVEADVPTLRASPERRTRMRILIVEDDPLMGTVYSGILKQAGYEVDTIADGSDAFQAIHQTSYDLLMLDIMLPQMDGMSILRRIRAQKSFQHLPILVVTGLKKGAIQAQSMAAGASQMISKDEVSPATLVSTVKALLDTASQATGLEDSQPGSATHKGPDFRVQELQMSAPEEPPKSLLKMVAPPEPPPPPPPPPPFMTTPVKLTESPNLPKIKLISTPEEQAEEKKGLFKRLFSRKKPDAET